MAGIDLAKEYSRQVESDTVYLSKRLTIKNSSLGAYWETALSKLGSRDCFRLKSKQPHSC